MDRRDFAVCAGILASLGAITGCGRADVRSLPPTEQAAPRALVASEAGVPRTVEISSETPLAPYALPAEETPPMPWVAVDAALVQAADSPAAPTNVAQNQEVEAQPTTDAGALPAEPGTEPQVGFVADASRQDAQQTSTSASKGKPIASDSRLKSEVISPVSRPEPSFAKKSAQKKSQPASKVSANPKIADHESVSETAIKVEVMQGKPSTSDAAERAPTKSNTLKLDVAADESSSRVAIKEEANATPVEKAPIAKHLFKPVWIVPLAEPPRSKVAKQESPRRPFTPAWTTLPEKPVPSVAVKPKTSQPRVEEAPLAKQDAPKREMKPVEIAPLVVPELELRKPQTAPSEIVKQEAPQPEIGPAEIAPVEIVPLPAPQAEVARRTESPEPQVAKQETPKREMKPVEIAPLVAPELELRKPQTAASEIVKQEAPQPQVAPVEIVPLPAPQAEVARRTESPEPQVAKQEAPKREMKPVEIAPLVAPELELRKPQTAASEIAKQEAPRPQVAPVEIVPLPAPQAEVARRTESPEPQVAKQEAPKAETPLPAPTPREVAELESAPSPPAEREGPSSRPPEIMAVISQADERVGHGFKLADRGAIYLARAEFTAALKLIAQANDVEIGTRAASKAVSAGLVALKESGDFVRQTSGPEDVDVAKIISGHKTTLLKTADVSEMPPTVAADCYYAYAREQLSAAIRHEMVGSMALYGLGRAMLAGAGSNAKQMEYSGQAMSLYQAALVVEPRNFRAANELGVLMANHGQLKLARDMLTRSARLAPNAATWQNLAVVHNRMGDRKLADQLQAEAKEMQHAGPNPAVPSVQWVDPATFAAAAASTDGPMPAAAAAGAKTQPAPAKSPVEAAKPPASVAKRITDWIPLNLRR